MGGFSTREPPFLGVDEFRSRPLDGELFSDIMPKESQGLTMGPKGYVLIKTLIALDSLGKGADPAFQLKDHLTPILMRAYQEDFPE
jgi:hypothetical protein